MSLYQRIAIFIVCASFVTGCGGQPAHGYRNTTFGFSFDFPPGWSRLSAAEIQQMFGQTPPLVIISDAGREAHVALVTFDLSGLRRDLRVPLITQMAQERDIGAATALFTMLNSDLEALLAKQYDGFQVVDRTLVVPMPSGTATSVSFQWIADSWKPL